MLSKSKLLVSSLLDKTKLNELAQNSWRVLTYHRVINPLQSKLHLQAGMYVRPETFRMHIKYLSKNANVIPIDELATLLREGKKIPKKTISITFDDGWEDNYTEAYPILKEFLTPATIFIPTSYISSSKMFWTDKLSVLAQLFKEQNALFEKICENEEINLALEKLLSNDLDQDFDKEFENSILVLKKFKLEKRLEILNTLIHFLNFDPEMLIPPQYITWQQVLEMSKNNIIFGSHSHMHYELGSLDAESIKEDVNQSYKVLKERLGDNYSKVFCYPEGSKSEISQKALSEIGIEEILSVHWEGYIKAKPSTIGRVGIHQDISSKVDLLKNRIWLNKLF